MILKIQHAQTFKHGKVGLRKTKPTYIPITLVYADGKSVLAGGELWDVVKSKDSKATFETADAYDLGRQT